MEFKWIRKGENKSLELPKVVTPAADVTGADVVQLRVLSDLVTHCHRPEHLEKIL